MYYELDKDGMEPSKHRSADIHSWVLYETLRYIKCISQSNQMKWSQWVQLFAKTTKIHKGTNDKESVNVH